jgi:hypothetical protein
MRIMRFASNINLDTTTIRNLFSVDTFYNSFSVAANNLKVENGGATVNRTLLIKDPTVLNTRMGKISLEGILGCGADATVLFGLAIAGSSGITVIGIKRVNIAGTYTLDLASMSWDDVSTLANAGIAYDDGVIARFGRYALNYNIVGTPLTNGTNTWAIQTEMYVDGALKSLSTGNTYEVSLGVGAQPLVMGVVLYTQKATADGYIDIALLKTAKGSIRRETGDFE